MNRYLGVCKRVRDLCIGQYYHLKKFVEIIVLRVLLEFFDDWILAFAHGFMFANKDVLYDFTYPKNFCYPLWRLAGWDFETVKGACCLVYGGRIFHHLDLQASNKVCTFTHQSSFIR